MINTLFCTKETRTGVKKANFQLKARSTTTTLLGFIPAFISANLFVATFTGISWCKPPLKLGESELTGGCDVIIAGFPACDHRSARVMRAACEPTAEI